MNSRRKFLKKAGQHAVGVVAGSSLLHKNVLFQEELSISNGPIFLSTWNNTRANEAAYSTFQNGKSLLDAIEAGVKIPEEDSNDTSVGYGGFPDAQGKVTLDACIMDQFGNAGSVCFLENIAHPISVARKVMEMTPHVILVGEGAQQFAIEQGFAQKELLSEKAEEAYHKWVKEQKLIPVGEDNHDTIGMIGMDLQGNMCGGCSTSGWAFKKRGRVGDSPIIGAGLYVDNEVGAATATGLGELVLKTLGTFLIVELMRFGYPPAIACEKAIERIVSKYDVENQQVGYIAMNKYGQIGASAIKEGFEYTSTQNGETTVIKVDSYNN